MRRSLQRSTQDQIREDHLNPSISDKENTARHCSAPVTISYAMSTQLPEFLSLNLIVNSSNNESAGCSPTDRRNPTYVTTCMSYGPTAISMSEEGSVVFLTGKMI